MAALRKNMQSFRKLNNICTSYCRTSIARHLKTIFSKGDPLEYFLRGDVETILRRITGFDPERTFFHHKVKYANRPTYKVLTDEELQQEYQKGEEIKERRLQMPPFMNCREEPDTIIADDPDIAPAIDSNYVFVDISEDYERIKGYSLRPVVIRHENGQLKPADWHTFDRVSQIYFPVPGREVYPPKMFEEDNLEPLLKEENYLYILERACVQFEPDSSDFIRVTHRIYEHIAAHHCFDCLRSTRFFGPMAFYFAWINKIEPLLAEMIGRDLLVDAIDLINLKRIIHNQSIKEGDILKIIKDYYLEDSNKHHIEVLRDALNDLEKRLEAKMQKKQESC
ncbi:28S ribosomal protein S22, mitochondrial-like isoform X2 [Mercenaria mercenaria]|uniref:28S ribosomal protein S22, mitochondrial-like isoform X2 n=1 Tax=Mercenaria mercenaria TaxID=6596 RepID=UPI001E1D5ED3|nr:28S ribosomal protein S22, mitochondrial-like isoform X2 [Mercenaria mercenaria]